jgi:citrate lyase subunit beta / citryl-CoA lyase
MSMRSLLFVPADSERKLARAGESGADALILDLEDSVVSARREEARRITGAFLSGAARARQRIYVRINPLASDDALADLAAIMPSRPDGILLPKSTPADVRVLDHYLLALEAANGVARGATRVIAIATETPAAAFELGGYRGIATRLEGLTWGAEDIAAVLGAANRRPNGVYDDVFRLVRALCVLGAHAAGVMAIDTVFIDFRNEAGLAAECEAARRAGFVAKMAIHPSQVAVINRAFTPSTEELSWARQVVAAFAANPTSGTVGVDGRMLDRPHLVMAERLLARAGER